MKALIKLDYGPGNMEVKEVEKPKVEPGEVLIKVKYCAICTNDLQIYRDRQPYKAPVIMGHEIAGVIEQAGPGVRYWKPGDRVVLEVHTESCGYCEYCRTGNMLACESRNPIGRGVDGGFAEYVKVTDTLLHRIPEGLSFEEAALAEPTAIVVNALIERAKVKPGDFVVILGPGRMGLLSAQVAKAAGAIVLVAGVKQDLKYRLPLAKELGADYTLCISNGELEREVLRISDGIGADIVVDCTGSEKAIANAINIVKKLGTVAAIGVAGEPVISVPWDVAMLKSCKIYFTFSSDYTSWERVLAMMAAGEIKARPLITEILPVERWEEAFGKLLEGEAVKILLEP
jgi:L-iditol 2-dehydrogenase